MEQPRGVLKSLTTQCLESMAEALLMGLRGFDSSQLSLLPADLAERFQAILVQRNAFNNATLVASTSIHQTCLNIPFSMSNDTEPSLSHDSVLAAISKCENTLTSLNASGHELTSELLDRITSEPLRSNLVELQLVGCQVPLRAAAKILSRCPRLQTLNLSGNPELNDALFVFPTSFFPAIASPIAPTGYVLRNGLKVVNSLPATRTSRKRPSPSTQSLGNPSSTPSSISLSAPTASIDCFMQVDKNSCPGASDTPHPSTTASGISSQDCQTENTDMEEPIAKRPCLQEENQDLNALPSLALSASVGLSSLLLSGTNISDKSIDAISKLYPDLLDLDVSHCSNITDLTPVLLRCAQLRSLNISGTKVSSHSEKLLKFGLLSEKEAAMEENNFENALENAEAQDSPALKRRRYKFLRHLKSLIFSGSGRLDAGFVVWFEACSETLLELRLSNKSFPEDLIGHIHARNARMQVMNGQRDLLTAEQEQYLPLIVRLLSPCQSLQVLDIHGTNVSSNALILLFDGFKPTWTQTCEELDVVNCDEIDLKCLLHVFGLAPSEASAMQGVVFNQNSGAQTATWPSLKILRISGGKHAETLAGPELPQIGANGCPQLEHLVINNVRAGRAMLRPVHVGQILTRFLRLRSVEFWCCSSISYQLAAIVPQICKNIESVLLCVVGENAAPVMLQNLPLGPARAHVHHHHHNGHHADAVAAVTAAAEAMSTPGFLSGEQVKTLQKLNPSVEWKFWRHSVESSRNFQHIRPLNRTTREPVAILRPEQATNCLSVSVEATGLTDASLPLRSRLIKASVSVDGIPIWNGEKSASMQHLSQSIWGLVTHNAGALPVIEDWCCACNIEEFNGLLFYDDSEYVYWDVLEPGPKASFKFHKAQYVSAIASAMQQQWNVFTSVLPKEELVQQALLFTQQHAWHQQLLEQSKPSTSSTSTSSTSSSSSHPPMAASSSSHSAKVVPPTRG